MIRTALARLPASRYALRAPLVCASARRPFTAAAVRYDDQSDVMRKLEEQLAPREAVERKRKEMEEKYAAKLKKKVESEGVANLDALKEKVVAPSVLAKRKAEQYRREEREKDEKKRLEAEQALQEAKELKAEELAAKREAARAAQAEGDRAGVKPLASIINLPLILMTPHDQKAVSDIWTTYHTTHPTMSGSYLSASLPKTTYESMLGLARANPFFVLPMPRKGQDGAEDAFEMFYMQWLFHPPPPAPPLPESEGSKAASNQPLPPITNVIFTPLEEFKQAGEWAQPYLVLTHYPDLADSHDLVLMRGEISPQSAGGPPGAVDNPGYLLSQQEAQLLILALQRFYCADIVPPHEDATQKEQRLQRKQALSDFREKPQDWDWHGLVGMAYGGLA